MTRDQKIYRAAYWIASILLGLVFLAGYRKVLHPLEFARAVYGFYLLPDVLIKPFAYVVPWVELICAVSLLCIPKWRVPALRMSLMLLLAFTGAILISLLRGLEVHCGCFGTLFSETPLSWDGLGRNTLLILLNGLALFGHKKSRPEAGCSVQVR